jgi:hypothetical protein
MLLISVSGAAASASAKRMAYSSVPKDQSEKPPESGMATTTTRTLHADRNDSQVVVTRRLPSASFASKK